MAILSALWKIRKTMKQADFPNTRLTRIIAKTNEILPLVPKLQSAAATICHTCLGFYIENVFGFTGNRWP